MDRLEAMGMLLEVVERGSLSAAGRALRVPVATLSRRLNDLEAQLGSQLLVRTTRKVTLTDAGLAYVEAARRILEQVDEAERAAAGEFQEPKGEFILTAPAMFGRLHVLPLVAEYLERYPRINIRLILADRNMHLVDDHVDMAVRIGSLPSSSLIATRLGSMRKVLCASPELLARVGRPQQPEALTQLPCITVDAALLSPGWRFADGVQVPIMPRLAVTTTDAARAAALAHVGFTRLLHYQVVDALQAGTLQALLLAHEPEPVPVHLVHAARGQMPLKLRCFIDFAVPRLRQVLQSLEVS